MHVPNVRDICRVESPPVVNWERQEFPAPIGDRMLVLVYMGEWAMGAASWSMELWEGLTDVTSNHSYLRFLNDRSGVSVATNMSPWLADGSSIILLPTGRASDHSPVIYDIDRHRGREFQIEEWCLSVQCAPVGDGILVPRVGGVELLSGAQHVRSIEWSHPDQQWPYSGWLSSGQTWFAIGPREKEEESWIWFFDLRGEVTGKQSLDRLKVDPFDCDRFSKVIGSHDSLRLGTGRRSIGTQLLHWTDMRLVPNQDRIFLALMMPTGDPFVDEGKWHCPAEERWYSVALDE